MNRRRLAQASAALLLLPALGGCVAAAIPVLAAGGLVVRETEPGNETGDAVPVVEVEPKAAPAVPAAEIGKGELPPRDSADAALEQAAVAPPPTLPPATGVTATAVAATASASATGALIATGNDDIYARFGRYALEQARLDPVAAPRRSAILAEPGSLAPTTTDCGILPPAVIVDLDPADASLDPTTPLPGNPALSAALASLRTNDVAVFWISGSSAAAAGQLRERLVATGLDPWGRDGLLLMRRSGDRKDARRRELAETHCVTAIVGDTRSDFDELFDFLRDPAAAAPLEPLVDAGWFLTSPPIAAKED